MDKKAVTKARSRLRAAETLVDELKDCTDFSRFDELWYLFLTAAKNIYTALEQGAKVSPQSRQWFGRISAERRKDPLLQYLFQARNDDEHGLDEIVKKNPGAVGIFIEKDGPKHQTASLTFTWSPEGPKDLRDFKTSEGARAEIITSPSRIELIPVHDRGGNIYNPPTTHMGAPISDCSPYGVARCGVTHLANVISEAEALS